jgi:uncharacterized phage protein (TIGR01671 family)
MREIKFRAWYKPKGKMYTRSLESINLETKVLGVYTVSEGYQQLRMSDFEIMQYTGLKDKIGKEIYEGDIVRRDFEVGRTIIDPVSLGIEDYEIDDSGYWIGVVHYRPSEGYILNKCRKYNDDDELQKKKSGVKIYPNYAVVIGNIFKNPELLEDGDSGLLECYESGTL